MWWFCYLGLGFLNSYFTITFRTFTSSSFSYLDWFLSIITAQHNVRSTEFANQTTKEWANQFTNMLWMKPFTICNNPIPSISQQVTLCNLELVHAVIFAWAKLARTNWCLCFKSICLHWPTTVRCTLLIQSQSTWLDWKWLTKTMGQVANFDKFLQFYNLIHFIIMYRKLSFGSNL